MENLIRQLMLIGVLALIAICCPDRIKAQSIFGVGNASDDSNVVLVSGECNNDPWKHGGPKFPPPKF
jgi:hypothetical protein